MAAQGPTTTKPRGDVEVALDQLRDSFVAPPQELPDGSTVVFTNAFMQEHKFPALNPKLPDRVTAHEVLVEETSFIAYVQQFASSTAICRASLGRNQIEGVLDYHGRAREDGSSGIGADGAKPQPATHRVTLQCPYDPDYQAWQNVFGKSLTQYVLATFIEDMIHTIADPPAADLMEAVNDLRIDRSVRFKSGRNERNGTVQIQYDEVDEEHPGSGSLTLPQKVTIVVPIFQGGMPVQLECRLRYALERGALSLTLTVPGLEKIERDHFRNLGERIADATNVPVFYTA